MSVEGYVTLHHSGESADVVYLTIDEGKISCLTHRGGNLIQEIPLAGRGVDVHNLDLNEPLLLENSVDCSPKAQKLKLYSFAVVVHCPKTQLFAFEDEDDELLLQLPESVKESIRRRSDPGNSLRTVIQDSETSVRPATDNSGVKPPLPVHNRSSGTNIRGSSSWHSLVSLSALGSKLGGEMGGLKSMRDEKYHPPSSCASGTSTVSVSSSESCLSAQLSSSRWLHIGPISSECSSTESDDYERMKAQGRISSVHQLFKQLAKEDVPEGSTVMIISVTSARCRHQWTGRIKHWRRLGWKESKKLTETGNDYIHLLRLLESYGMRQSEAYQRTRFRSLGSSYMRRRFDQGGGLRCQFTSHQLYERQYTAPEGRQQRSSTNPDLSLSLGGVATNVRCYGVMRPVMQEGACVGNAILSQ